VAVPVTHYQQVPKTGFKTVCELVPVQKEYTVHVTHFQQVAKTGVKTVCELVPEQQEIVVNVTHCQPVHRTGVRKRLVCETVSEVVPVTEAYTELVPYSYKVQVPAGCH
jgi:hypothetical protein